MVINIFTIALAEPQGLWLKDGYIQAYHRLGDTKVNRSVSMRGLSHYLTPRLGELCFSVKRSPILVPLSSPLIVRARIQNWTFGIG